VWFVDLVYMPSSMETNNLWDDLIFAIRRQECILAIGSGISTGKDERGEERPLAEIFAEHLADLMERDNKTPESDRHNLLQMSGEFLHARGKIPLQREAMSFYERFPTPNAIQNQLAALPFHLILSAAPDTLMMKALERNNKLPTLNYYKPPGIDRTTAYRNIVKPTVSHPLIFNMLGVWTEPDSVVLTENNQLEFLEDIIRNSEAIPNSLLEICGAEKSTFIFTGFDFERWQLRLLLRVLKLDGAEKIAHWAVQKPETLKKDTVLFFKYQYGVHFLDMNTAQFVEELARRYASTAAPAAVSI
jgi:SIR2-like domain